MRLLREVGVHRVEQRVSTLPDGGQQNHPGNGDDGYNDSVFSNGGGRAATNARNDALSDFSQHHNAQITAGIMPRLSWKHKLIG